MSLPSVMVVILAGGLGTRLRPLTNHRPKPTLPVLGQPMLFDLLDQLDTSWIHSIICTVSYGAQEFEKILSSRNDPRIQIVTEQEPLGTGGALAALDSVSTERVLVFNGDTSLHIDLAAFYRFHLEQQAQASLACVRVEHCERYGKVELNGEGQVSRFVEKDNSQSGSGWVNAGAYLLEPSVWESRPSQRKFSLERDLFGNLDQQRFFGWRSDGHFIDLGTPQSYLQSNLSGIQVHPTAIVHPTAKLESSVWIGANCKVGPGVILKDCMLDDGAEVEANSHLEQSILGRSVTIARGSKFVQKILVEGEASECF